MQRTIRPPLGTTLLTYARHYDHNYTVAWSPDGKSIVSVNYYDGKIELWDAATWQHLAFCPQLGMVNAAAWSPDGTYVALAQGSVHIWNPQTNEIISANLDGGYDHWSRSLGWSPDMTRIASSSHRNSIQIWDVQSGEGIYNYLGHTTTITGVVWSPDGKYIASASIDGLVQVWDAAAGETLLSFRKHTKGATAVAWSPDSAYVASACSSEVFVWEALTGTIITACQHEAHGQIAVAWSPDRKRIVSNAFSGVAIVWDAFSGEILCIYDEPTASGSDVVWSPDGKTIASTGLGIFLWDAWSGETRLIRGEPSEVSDAKPSPDGRHVASVYNDPLLIWDAQSGERVGAFGDYNAYCLISSFDWSPDGQQIVTAHLYGALVVWRQVTEGPRPREILVYCAGGDQDNNAHAVFMRDVAWSPDGKYIACGRNDLVEIWDVASRALLLTYRGHVEQPESQVQGRRNLVRSLSWSPDGQRIVSRSETSAQVWDARDGTHLYTYDAERADAESAALDDSWPFSTKKVAWAPDGSRIAAAYASTIHVWQADSGQNLTIYRGHQHIVSTLAWSPDSTLIASGVEQGSVFRSWEDDEDDREEVEDDEDDRSYLHPRSPEAQVIHLWRVGQDEEKPYYIYRGHSYNGRPGARIRDIRWFSDGERIASANREVQIWQARE